MIYIERKKNLYLRWFKYILLIPALIFSYALENYRLTELVFALMLVMIYTLYYDLQEEVHSIRLENDNSIIILEIWGFVGFKKRIVKMEVDEFKIRKYRIRNFFSKRETYHLYFNGSKYHLDYEDWEYNFLDLFLIENDLLQKTGKGF